MSEFVPLSHILRPTFLVQVQPMRLIKIYNVAKEETFLAHLLENDLTLTALKTVVQDRARISVSAQRLVYRNHDLKPGKLPEECLQDTQESVHLIPAQLDPTKAFTVFVKIAGGGRNPIMLTNPNYLTTVEDLKIRLYETCRLRPSRINIYKDGTHLDNAQYSLLYYGILPGTHLEAREILPLRTKNSLKMRVFVRTHRGKTEVHLVHPQETIRELKEMMYEWTGVPIRFQRLVFGGRHLEDHKTVEECEIRENSTISLMRHRGVSEGGNIESSRRELNGALELDHFAYLLGKTLEMFREGVDPHDEIIQHLFEKWKDRVTSSNDIISDEIKKYKLDQTSSQIFYDLRLELSQKGRIRTTLDLGKFLAVLWIAQEILKLSQAFNPLSNPLQFANPGWRVQYLKWDDVQTLQQQTDQNTQMLLSLLEPPEGYSEKKGKPRKLRKSFPPAGTACTKAENKSGTVETVKEVTEKGGENAKGVKHRFTFCSTIRRLFKRWRLA